MLSKRTQASVVQVIHTCRLLSLKSSSCNVLLHFRSAASIAASSDTNWLLPRYRCVRLVLTFRDAAVNREKETLIHEILQNQPFSKHTCAKVVTQEISVLTGKLVAIVAWMLTKNDSARTWDAIALQVQCTQATVDTQCAAKQGHSMQVGGRLWHIKEVDERWLPMTSGKLIKGPNTHMTYMYNKLTWSELPGSSTE